MDVYVRNKNNFILSEVFASACALSTYFPNNPRKYRNDEVERNLSCKCTVLCHILEYMYILQITKRRIGPVLAFNVQIPDQVECLAVFACWKHIGA